MPQPCPFRLAGIEVLPLTALDPFPAECSTVVAALANVLVNGGGRSSQRIRAVVPALAARVSSPTDQLTARTALLDLLLAHDHGSEPICGDYDDPPVVQPVDHAEQLVATLIDMTTDAEARARLRATFIRLLQTTDRSDVAQTIDAESTTTAAWNAVRMAHQLTQLDPSPDDRASARTALAGLLDAAQQRLLPDNLAVQRLVEGLAHADIGRPRPTLPRNCARIPTYRRTGLMRWRGVQWLLPMLLWKAPRKPQARPAPPVRRLPGSRQPH